MWNCVFFFFFVIFDKSSCKLWVLQHKALYSSLPHFDFHGSHICNKVMRDITKDCVEFMRQLDKFRARQHLLLCLYTAVIDSHISVQQQYEEKSEGCDFPPKLYINNVLLWTWVCLQMFSNLQNSCASLFWSWWPEVTHSSLPPEQLHRRVLVNNLYG